MSNCIVYYVIMKNNNNRYQFLNQFPNEILNWKAIDVDYSKKTLSVLRADKIVYKSYQKRDSLPVDLFIASYNDIDKADYSHSPIVCFTGQGWDIDKVDKISIQLNDKKRIVVNQLIQDKLDHKMITLYWYQTTMNAYSNRGIEKILLFKDRLFGKSVNNAFVRVTIDIPANSSAEKIKSYLYLFVSDIYPEIRRYLS